jgi:hypothetical protein
MRRTTDILVITKTLPPENDAKVFVIMKIARTNAEMGDLRLMGARAAGFGRGRGEELGAGTGGQELGGRNWGAGTGG